MQVLDHTQTYVKATEVGFLVADVRHSAYLIGAHWFSAADHIGWRHGKTVEAIKFDGAKPIAYYDVIRNPDTGSLLHIHGIQMIWAGELTTEQLALTNHSYRDLDVAINSAWPASTRLWLIRGQRL